MHHSWNIFLGNFYFSKYLEKHLEESKEFRYFSPSNIRISHLFQFYGNLLACIWPWRITDRNKRNAGDIVSLTFIYYFIVNDQFSIRMSIIIQLDFAIVLLHRTPSFKWPIVLFRSLKYETNFAPFNFEPESPAGNL